MPGRAQHRNRAKKRLHAGTPGFSAGYLRGVKHRQKEHVQRNQHSNCSPGKTEPIVRRKAINEGKNNDSEMKKKSRISEIANHLPREARTVLIMICQQAEA